MASEMTDLESVTDMSMLSSSCETDEDGPADIFKPMVDHGAGAPKGLSHCEHVRLW